MPVLPFLHTHRTIAPDARSLESRQLLDAASAAAEAVSRRVRARFERIPTILPRQVVAIPLQYQGLNAGPAPGAVAGIVLGSVAGFIFIVWLLWFASNGSTGFIRSSTTFEEEEDVVVTRRRSASRGTRRSHHHHHHRRPAEMSETRSSRPTRVVRTERVIRTSVPPPREPSRIRETVIIDDVRPPPERRVEGDDIVEVIEENSSIGMPPAPRRQSRRSGSGYR